MSPSTTVEAQAAPKARPKSFSSAPAVAGSSTSWRQREANLRPWHVAIGDEGAGSDARGLIIAARSSRATASTVVEFEKLFHPGYKRNIEVCLCYSRILVAQVDWGKPMHGKRVVRLMNVHLHHSVAKKDWILK